MTHQVQRCKSAEVFRLDIPQNGKLKRIRKSPRLESEKYIRRLANKSFTKKRSSSASVVSTSSIKQTPRRKSDFSKDQLELPFAFTALLFEDEDLFIVRYLLDHAEHKKLMYLLRSVLEISIIDDCANQFLLRMLQHHTLCLASSINLIPHLKFGSLKISFSLDTTKFQYWMALQAYVALRSATIIKRIDMKVSQILHHVHDSIENNASDGEDGIEDTVTELNQEEVFFQVLRESIGELDIDPNVTLSFILKAAEEIVIAISEIIEELPFEISELANHIEKFMEKDSNSCDIFLFWCFFYPMLNLTPLVSTRRTKIPQKLNGLLMLCYLLIQEAAVNHTEIFISKSVSVATAVQRIQSLYRLTMKKFGTTHEKNLGDTVLHFCSVGDGDKALLLLCEEFTSHIGSIWDHLLQSQNTQNMDIMMQFIPFIRCGISEIG